MIKFKTRGAKFLFSLKRGYKSDIMKRKLNKEDIEQMSGPSHSLCVLKHSPGAVRRLNASQEGGINENLHVDSQQPEVVKEGEKKKWYKTIWGIITGIAVIVGFIVGIIQLILWL